MLDFETCRKCCIDRLIDNKELSEYSRQSLIGQWLTVLPEDFVSVSCESSIYRLYYDDNPPATCPYLLNHLMKESGHA